MRIEEYKTHLQEHEKLSPSSITEHINNMKRFDIWSKEQQYINIDNLTYLELLNFVKHQKEKNIKVQTIKLRLNSISKYYEYLKHIGIIDKNPTKKIRLKGEQKNITQNVFTYTELEQLYNDYINLKSVNQSVINQRNKVLAGLMLWQGANSGELEKMTREHLNLEQGTVYIPKSRRGAGRELKLLPNQIVQLYKYLYETLPILLKIKQQQANATINSNYLFHVNVCNTLHTIVEELKGINQKVHNASQLRTSMIIHWIKVYGKRQAQYMAGHKYISSTEKIELQEIDSLTDTLLKHHPFN